MTILLWNEAFAHSWIGKIIHMFNRWWVHSQAFSIGESIWKFLRTAFVQSKVYGYFQSNQLSISKTMRQSSILKHLFLLIFHAFTRLNRLTHSIFDGSLTDRLIHSFNLDARTNPVRYLASFFFSGFVIWVILTLLFGSGFSKTEMFIILLMTFLAWFLSHLRINTVQAIRNSRFIQWFCSWFYSPDETDKVKS